MGIDATLYFQALKPGAADIYLGDGITVDAIAGRPGYLYGPTGATHEVHLPWRYYGKGYERGPWPEICAVLMTLHAQRSVGKVWYGGDSDDVPAEFTTLDVLVMSGHYMMYADRPYRHNDWTPKTPSGVTVHNED